MAILTGAFGYLRPGGAFYQFTYSPRCPVPTRIMDRPGLGATRIGLALRNIPPAAVYRISRKKGFSAPKPNPNTPAIAADAPPATVPVAAADPSPHTPLPTMLTTLNTRTTPTAWMTPPTRTTPPVLTAPPLLTAPTMLNRL